MPEYDWNNPTNYPGPDYEDEEPDYVPSPPTEDDICLECDGDGTVHGQLCKTCRGIGRV